MDEIENNDDLQSLWQNSKLTGASADYLEGLYEDYLINPSLVDDQWRLFFDEMKGDNPASAEPIHSDVRESFRHLATSPQKAQIVAGSCDIDIARHNKQVNVQNNLTQW